MVSIGASTEAATDLGAIAFGCPMYLLVLADTFPHLASTETLPQRPDNGILIFTHKHPRHQYDTYGQSPSCISWLIYHPLCQSFLTLASGRHMDFNSQNLPASIASGILGVESIYLQVAKVGKHCSVLFLHQDMSRVSQHLADY